MKRVSIYNDNMLICKYLKSCIFTAHLKTTLATFLLWGERFWDVIMTAFRGRAFITYIFIEIFEAAARACLKHGDQFCKACRFQFVFLTGSFLSLIQICKILDPYYMYLIHFLFRQKGQIILNHTARNAFLAPCKRTSEK